MKNLFLIAIFLILTNCNKPKTVLICGDHECVNKTEAEQYFEENLTIEVKIIDKKVKEKLNLVELNLKQNQNGKKEISVTKKISSKKNLKVLSNEEVNIIKNNIKNKKKIAKKIKATQIKKKEKEKTENEKLIESKAYKNIKNSKTSQKQNIVDICTLIEKCSIDEISKYILENDKKKKFPDITTRQ